MNAKIFVGVDVSKGVLDFAVYQGSPLFHLRVENSLDGIKEFFDYLNEEIHFSNQDLIVCMEHTGIYCNRLLDVLTKRKMCIWLENSAVIKAFHGLARGKSDKLDAWRIAHYAYEKRDQIRVWQPPRNVVKQLKYLTKIRERLVKTKSRLNTPVKEADGFVDKKLTQAEKKVFQPIVQEIANQILVVEKKIRHLIENDPFLKNLYKIIISVEGIGPVTAYQFIVVTNEFKDIADPRKMACHCGVAPFPNSSGTFKGKSRVSHRANKTMKTLLTLGAMSLISGSGELNSYYNRKLEEGKNKMAVINAIRNKIIHRIFACVRENRKYEKINILALA